MLERCGKYMFDEKKNRMKQKQSELKLKWNVTFVMYSYLNMIENIRRT